MTSRLSSLLVRDGVVGVQRMEKAFQKQVLRGGTLDTILLEMNELTEQRLSQYLSLASGLPPALASELSEADPSVADDIPLDLVDRFHVLPFGRDGDAVRIATCDPIDIGALEELANELGRAIQPFVIPQFRYQLALARLYGAEVDKRYHTLAGRMTGEAPINPVGKPKTIVVDGEVGGPVTEVRRSSRARVTQPIEPREEGRRRAPARDTEMDQPVEADEVAAGDIPEAASTDPDLRLAEAPEPASTDPDIGVARRPDEDDDYSEMVVEGEPEPDEPVPDIGAVPVERHGPSDTQRVPYVPELARSSETVAGQIQQIDGRSVRVSEQRRATARTMAEFDPTPMSVTAAREELEHAEHRDTVFEILLRAIRAHCRFAAVLTVQGGAAIGRVALDDDVVDQEAIGKVLIPLDTPSNFKQAVQSGAPYIGKVSTGDSSIDSMIRRLGGTMPPSAVILPLSLKGRVVALLVGHRGTDSVVVRDVSELMPLPGYAQEALGRIIRRAKAGDKGGGKGGSSGNGAVSAEMDELASTQKLSGDRAAEAADEGELASTHKLTAKELGKVVPDAHHVDAAAEIDIERVMAQVQKGGDGEAEEAIAQALAWPDETLRWLEDNFPGKLLVSRIEAAGRHVRPAQHGSALDVVVRLGERADSLLSALMADHRHDVRYFAALCAAEIRGSGMLTALTNCLFDSDYGVREVAIEALGGYPFRALDQALVVPRAALGEEDVMRREAAARALAQLTDIGSVPLLIDALARGGSGQEALALALVSLTKQDFGQSVKKWRQWWDKNRGRHRIEWMIDGLVAKDAGVRRSAVEDLRKTTGEYFGFGPDQPKREREQARARWLEWWNQSGHRRFSGQSRGERHRPTGLLPRR